MTFAPPINGCLIWSFLAAVFVSGANAQTIELKSVRISTLTRAEQERFVAAHNAARKAVDVNPVRWSDELSRYARESLEQQKESLIEAAKTGWTERRVVLPNHRADSEYGENVAGWAGTRSHPAERAVALWLTEKAAFERLNVNDSYRVGDEDGKVESDDKGVERPVVVGHYTAIVWRATKEIGAAMLEFELDDGCASRTYVGIICNYNPPGNTRGEKPY